MTARAINVHAVPPRGNVSRWGPERRTPVAERFGDHLALIVVGAADRGAVPERWGLGLALVVVGQTVFGAELIVADDHGERDRPSMVALASWAEHQDLTTPNGVRPVRVVTRRQFCDPSEGSLIRHTYRGGGWLVTADEGRTLGLLAEWWRPAQGRFTDGFSLGLPGWGKHTTWTDTQGRRRSGWRSGLHTPPLRAKALGAHGLLAEYGRAGRGGRTESGQPAGHWERERPFLGRIVDLIGPAFALDGRDTGDLSAHLVAFGHDPLDLPAAVPVNPASADLLLAVAHGLHRLVLTLDQELACWLVSAGDLAEGTATVGLRDLVSGGSLATRLWRRSGATPPLAKFGRPDDRALDQYAAGSHGGWCTAELRGEVLPAVDADVRQAYPAVACLAGLHRVLFAEHLDEVDQTEEVRALAAAAAMGDWGPFLDRSTYERHALTRCLVLPQGEPWPVELEEKGGARLVVRSATSTEPMAATFGDVMAASDLAGRPARIVTATGLLPRGTEQLREVPLCDDVVVPVGADPLAALVRLRPPKGTDNRRRDCIRGVTNPAAWGIFARLDQRWVDDTLVEQYAPWSWPVAAACVPAIVRLWLALVERAVTDAGGAVICRDTDGLALVSSADGGTVTLAGGRTVRALTWGEVDHLFARFDVLDPFGDGQPCWEVVKEVEGRPLQLLSLARKRYTRLVSNGQGLEVAGGTEHSLGGGVADPPGWDEVGAGGLRRWVRSVHEYAVARATGPDPGWQAPWDQGADQPFPVIRRYATASPGALAEVPAALGLHPFGSYLQAEPDKVVGDPGAPVALDPGDDLAHWATATRWFDRDGQRVRIGTARQADVVLRTLEEYAWRWAQAAPPEDHGVIEIDPRLIRRVGRGGALVDAHLADPEARPEDHQVLYSEGDAAAFVGDLARNMGKRAFARRFSLPLKTAERLALGQRPSARTVDRVRAALAEEETVSRSCALDGCEAPVGRPNARFCSKLHADRAYRARKATRAHVPQARPTDPYAEVPCCQCCGALMLGAADAGNGFCVECAEVAA
ncbi:MAG: hypothetical protein ACYCU7_16200 [Acidimicrobiales bacterium]